MQPNQCTVKFLHELHIITRHHLYWGSSQYVLYCVDDNKIPQLQAGYRGHTLRGLLRSNCCCSRRYRITKQKHHLNYIVGHDKSNTPPAAINFNGTDPYVSIVQHFGCAIDWNIICNWYTFLFQMPHIRNKTPPQKHTRATKTIATNGSHCNKLSCSVQK